MGEGVFSSLLGVLLATQIGSTERKLRSTPVAARERGRQEGEEPLINRESNVGPHFYIGVD